MTDTQMTAASIVALFQTTKEERASFVQKLVTSVTEGEADPLKVHLQIKCMEEIIKNVKDDPNYRTTVLAEAQKHGKSFEFMNAKIEIKENGVKYNFDKTNDSEIIDLLKQQEELKAKIEKRATFLKALPEGGQLIINEDTGEEIKIYRPIKTSTTGPVVTLK